MKKLFIPLALFFSIQTLNIHSISLEEQKNFEGFSIDLKNESDQAIDITDIEGWHEGLKKTRLNPNESMSIVVKPGTRFKVHFLRQEAPAGAESTKKQTKKWWQLWQKQPNEQITATYLIEIGNKTGIAKITFGRKSWLSWIFGGQISSSGVMIKTFDVSAKPDKESKPVIAGETAPEIPLED